MDKKLKKYLWFSFGLAWLFQLVAAISIWNGNRMLYTILLALCMYMPMVGGLLSGYSLKSVGWRLSFKKNWKVFLLSWFGPALLGTLGALLFFLCFPSSFDTTGSYLIAQVGPEALAQLEAQGLSLPLYYVIQCVAVLTYAPLINGLFAVGEEIGWRGFMNPAFKERYGKRNGLLLGGVVWGAWHWPIMILAGYEYGTAYWGFPIFGMVLFCLVTTAMGILLDYVYEKSGSIVVPAIAHGAINGFAGIPLMFLNSSYLNFQLLGPTMVGLLGSLPMVLCAFLLWRKKQ